MNGIYGTYGVSPHQRQALPLQNNDPEKFSRFVGRIYDGMPAEPELNNEYTAQLFSEVMEHLSSFISISDKGDRYTFEILFKLQEYSAQAARDTGYTKAHQWLYNCLNDSSLFGSPTAALLKAKFQEEGILWPQHRDSAISLLKIAIQYNNTRSTHAALYAAIEMKKILIEQKHLQPNQTQRYYYQSQANLYTEKIAAIKKTLATMPSYW